MNTSEEFLYQLRVTRPGMLTEGPTPEESRRLEQHTAYLNTLAERDVLILAGRTQVNDPSTFGIVIIRADDRDAASHIMNDDPTVKHGVMSAELFPFRVAFRS